MKQEEKPFDTDRFFKKQEASLAKPISIKKGIKNGYIVKIKDGRVGMVTWKKDNDNIGINFVNFHQITSFMGKDKNPKEQFDWIMRLGADDVFTKDDIIEVVRDNEIYKNF